MITNIKNFEIDGFLFKNYSILNNEEQKIALEFRNKNRVWMINQEIIDIDSHKKWINSLKKDMKTLYFLVFKDNIPFVSIDFHDIDWVNKEAYWGYFLGNEKYRIEVLKIEKIVIKIAFEILKLQRLWCISEINNNVISIHRFFGFVDTEVVCIDNRKFQKMYLENKG